MLIFTEEGKAAVLDALSNADATGHCGDKFRSSLHAQLSRLNLRDGKIELTWGKFKSTPNTAEVKYNFESEFSLRWLKDDTGEPYMHGCLYWHDNTEEFSTHT